MKTLGLLALGLLVGVLGHHLLADPVTVSPSPRVAPRNSSPDDVPSADRDGPTRPSPKRRQIETHPFDPRQEESETRKLEALVRERDRLVEELAATRDELAQFKRDHLALDAVRERHERLRDFISTRIKDLHPRVLDFVEKPPPWATKHDPRRLQELVTSLIATQGHAASDLQVQDVIEYCRLLRAMNTARLEASRLRQARDARPLPERTADDDRQVETASAAVRTAWNAAFDYCRTHFPEAFVRIHWGSMLPERR